MTRSERLLYHQIHPVKVLTDVASTVASLWLLWNRQWVLGLALAVLPSLAVSALLVMTADLRSLRDSPAGRLLRQHMTPRITAVRAAGAVIGTIGAVVRQWWLIGLGALIVALAWGRCFILPSVQNE